MDRQKKMCAPFDNRLEDLVQYINQTLFLSLKDYEVHMTVYPTGSFYKRHLDQFKKDDHRKLSIICYLNVNWKETEGGQLRMHLPALCETSGGKPEETKDVFPIAGRLVCFRKFNRLDAGPVGRVKTPLKNCFKPQATSLIFYISMLAAGSS
jgi:Rps23 Pro-64 3,4-dihydroxylase Tpa1-like proline 4-hydroxylase